MSSQPILTLAAMAVALFAAPALPTEPKPARPVVVVMKVAGRMDYRPGQLLAPDAVIKLGVGQRVLLLEGGGTRLLDGPGVFRPGEPGKEAQRTLGLLFAQRQRAVIAGMRGRNKNFGLQPSLWSIDVDRGGHACFVEKSQANIWRRDVEEARSITVRPLDDANASTVLFPTGTATAEWPAAQEIRDGSKYLLGRTGVEILVNWHQIPSPTSLSDLARALADARCYGQLDALDSH